MVFILRLFRLRYDLTANLVRPNYKTTIDNDEKAGYGRNNQLEKFFKKYYNSADLLVHRQHLMNLKLTLPEHQVQAVTFQQNQSNKISQFAVTRAIYGLNCFE